MVVSQICFSPLEPTAGSPLPAASPVDFVIEGAGQHPGYGIAKSQIIKFELKPMVLRNVEAEQVDSEVRRLESAARQLMAEFQALIDGSTQSMAQTALSDSIRYLQPTNDLMVDSQKAIRERAISAEFAVQEAFDAFFRNVDHEFTRDRAYESLDVKNRLLKILYPAGSDVVAQLREQLEAITEPKVLFIENLSPAQALQIEVFQSRTGFIKGLSIKNTSHIGHQDLVLRGLQCPVVGSVDFMKLVELGTLVEGEEVIIDGDRGFLTFNPSQEARTNAYARMYLLDAPEGEVSLSSHAPRTKDGVLMRILGDLLSPSQMKEFSARRVMAIGLVRTEFSALRANRWPTELEQIQEYKSILQGVSPGSVTLRTFDFGFDKTADFLSTDESRQSGLRGLRYMLSIYPEQFRIQLRAMVQAACEVGNEIRIIFPMVLNARDMKNARSAYNQVVGELVAEGKIARAPQNLKLGPMIETSSSVVLVDQIARHSDVLFVGSNDLLLSTLDGDLNKAAGAHYDPAFLACLRTTVRAGRAAGIEVFVCGEMPNHSKNIPLIVGTGATNIVVGYGSVGEVNAKIARCDSSECADLVDKIIETGDDEEAYALRNAELERLRQADQAK
jgi:phosphoenolpyruvate-protein kinase (PTS system EI component)